MAQSLKVNKWGNSLALRIPSYVAHSLELKAGDKSNSQQFEEWLELFNRGEVGPDFAEWQQAE